jgi:hypothetical protein
MTQLNQLKNTIINNNISKPRKMVYLFARFMDSSCSIEIISSFRKLLGNGERYNISSIKIDQSPIPQEIQAEFKWLCSYYQIKGIPQDNCLVMQNVGLNISGVYEVLIFVDEEYLPIIRQSILVAKNKAIALQNGTDEIWKGWKRPVPNVTIEGCDFGDNNILLKYHTKWAVDYPNLDILTNPQNYNVEISSLQADLVKEINDYS